MPQQRPIKIQIPGHATVKSVCQNENGQSGHEQPFTFIAYSDTMKARMLESILHNAIRGKSIFISFCDEQRDGEWHEPLSPDAFQLKLK